MYDVNTITVNGLALLAGASAANRLIYTRMLTSEDAFTAEEAAVAETSDFDGPEGSISAASATDNVARIIGAVRNATDSAVSLKTFVLCGRLENSTEDEVMLVISDADASVILPATGGPDAAASVAFSLVLAAGESAMVTVTPAGSASIADLARFVSAHKAGDTQAGDTQAIYGEKTFYDDVYARLDIHAGGEIYGNSIQVGTVMANAEGVFGSNVYITGGGLEVAGNIEPGEGISASIGSQGYPFASAYVGQLVMTAGRIYMPVTGSIQHAGSIEFSHNTAVNQASVYGGNARLLLNTGVSDNQSLINLTVDGQKGLQITYSTQISDYQLSVTTARMNVTSDFVTFSANTSVTISGNATINSLSVNALTGTQPTYSGSTTTVKVGSIVMAWVRPNLVSGNYFRAGQAYHSSGTSSDTSTTLEIAESANNTFKRSTYSRILPNGIYAFLSDVDNSVATCTLVQCLSLD